MGHPDLVVCVRCHKDRLMVVDTLQSIRHSVHHDTVVMAAVDGNVGMARQIEVHGFDTYAAPGPHGWGAGLFGLLMESVDYARQRYGPTHFASVDTDTLFLRPHADELLLTPVVDEQIGLVGRRRKTHPRWATTYATERRAIERVLGPQPQTYTPGEGIVGACMVLTYAFCDALSSNGYLKVPRCKATSYTTMADDHLIALVARTLGFRIENLGPGVVLAWRNGADPRGVEKRGARVYCPITRISKETGYSRDKELEARNYFRHLRGNPPLV